MLESAFHMWKTLAWPHHFTQRESLGPLNWFNPTTFYWSACSKHGKGTVVCLCVKWYHFCIFPWFSIEFWKYFYSAVFIYFFVFIFFFVEQHSNDFNLLIVAFCFNLRHAIDMSLIKGHIIIPTTTHLSTFSLPRGEDQFLITQNIYYSRTKISYD